MKSPPLIERRASDAQSGLGGSGIAGKLMALRWHGRYIRGYATSESIQHRKAPGEQRDNRPTGSRKA